MKKNSKQFTRDYNRLYKKSYKNLKFLKSKKARMIRILCELIEPQKRFKESKINHTIVIFGSARILPPKLAKNNLKEVKKRISLNNNKKDKKELDKELIIAKAQLKSSQFYQAAYDLSKKLTEWSLGLPKKSRLHICSGGGPGIMEAANKGALEANGKSIGLGISLPFEQRVNKFVSNNLAFEFKYFFIRKYWFVLLAKSLVAFPGGYGTFDELFETLTLMQTSKIKGKTPIVLFGKKFWTSLINWELFIEWGLISKEDLSLIYITDSVNDAFDFLIDSIKRIDQEKSV